MLLQANTLAAYHSFTLSALDGSIGFLTVRWHPWPAEIATPDDSPHKLSSMIKRSACSSAGGSSMIGVPGNGVLLLLTLISSDAHAVVGRWIQYGMTDQSLK